MTVAPRCIVEVVFCCAVRTLLLQVGVSYALAVTVGVAALSLASTRKSHTLNYIKLKQQEKFLVLLGTEVTLC